MKKILIIIIPLLTIFLTINLTKADTFSYGYLDTSLKSPPACGDGSLDSINPDGYIPCTDDGYRVIQGTFNLSSVWNQANETASLNLNTYYEICKDSFCLDGRNSSIYGGNSYLNFNSDLISNAVLITSGSKNFLENSCISNCINPDIKSSDSFFWSIKLDPNFIPIGGNYTLETTFTPYLITTVNTFAFPINSIDSTISVTNKCGITEQQVIDNYYSSSATNNYQEKIYNPWMSYHEYYNNFNTVGVSGINEMLYGNPVPDFPGADSGTLGSGGTMCVEEGLVPNGYLYDFGDCTPKIPYVCSILPTIKLR